MYDLGFLLLGIIGLWLGTELVVRKAIILTQRFNVSSVFIGLSILAFGTDLPELIVAINGAIHNYQGIESSGVIVGNAIGSSISQISIIIGLTAIIHFLAAGKIQIRQLAVELIGAIILLALVAFDYVITWNDGAILIIAFLIYFITHLNRERTNKIEKVEEKSILLNTTSHILILILGLGIVILSSELTINRALKLANTWDVDQSFIGAVIIGLGTSLPELAISISAILKNKPGLSIGNIIGSNIFDILIPIGISSLISNIYIEPSILLFDMPFLLFISIVVIYFLSKKKGLQKKEGLGLSILYLVYVFLKYVLW
ncbi:MAG: calcium/sodium antiporter [Ekhidna sp.]